VLRSIVSIEEAAARTTRAEQLYGILERAGMPLPGDRQPAAGLRTVAQ
jgi:hypothetical protein